MFHSSIGSFIGEDLPIQRSFPRAGNPVQKNEKDCHNKSAMLLEKNGRASSGKRTRHIDIRFYFVADRVANGDLRIEHCPTEDMVADFFTKPLQGALFYKLRDLIMNIDPSSPYHSSKRSVLTAEDIGHTETGADQVASNPDEARSYKSVLMGDSQSNVVIT